MNISDSSGFRVVGISLAGKRLRGYIPSELCSLIYLYGNNLSGSLPPSICTLPLLHSLFFLCLWIHFDCVISDDNLSELVGLNQNSFRMFSLCLISIINPT
ncbi:hypothetical protein EUTSA_v10017984mg [Eutrema salsugineum]|uniref:Leucine-rich repeat-containing N-terminal plant-type domain-containing protein n=1 Tax=Eutrema salsugineum TaxID=72664 RepID=V4MFF2_EUTSA|nr:hypothetical protein EUTSA_v10017984mg [Eutrema salsugineum]